MLKKYILGISLLVVCMFTLSVASAPVLTNSVDADVSLLNEPGLLGTRALAWEAMINFNDGAMKAADFVMMGEATDANDGPPADGYDAPKSPTPPSPYVYAYFDDGLAYPNNKLTSDYRHFCDGIAKTWDLTLQWDLISYPETIDFTWLTSDFSAPCPYGSVFLRDSGGAILVNMSAVGIYTFSVTASGSTTFTITCENVTCPIEGENCFNPYTVTIDGDLDYLVSHSTIGFADDYSDTDMGSYDNGLDTVYQLIVTTDTIVDIIQTPDDTGGNCWSGIGLFDDCPDVGTLLASDTGSFTKDKDKGTKEILDYTLLASESPYFLMCDNYPSPIGYDYDLLIHKVSDVGVNQINTFYDGQELNANVSYPVEVEVCNYGNDESSIPVHVTITQYSGAAPPCDYEICIDDSYGDTWNGGTLDVLVNGVPVLTELNATDLTPGVWECSLFTVNDGDTITLDYTYGSYPTENDWELYDSNGILVFSNTGGSSDTAYDSTHIADCPSTGGVVVYDQTTTVALDAGECDDVALPNWYALAGDYTIVACTELPTDDNNGNNCSAVDVTVLPGIHDVGVTEVTSPPDHVYVGDPYTVEATVCNFGDFDEPTIPVHVDIYWINESGDDDDDDDDATSGVLFQEDFETGMPGAMTWNDYNPGEGDFYWMTYGDYYSECEPQSGTRYVCGDAWGYPSGGPSAAYDDGLETPEVDCSICEQVFVNYSNRNFLADTEAHIRVFQDGALLGSIPAGLTQEQQSTDISSLAANQDKISVEMYYDDVYNGGFWMFDNVIIFGVDTSAKGQPINDGPKALELVYTADATIALDEGECGTVSFSPDWIPGIADSYLITVTTELLNDWVPENDSANKTVAAFIPNVLNTNTGLWYSTIQEAVDTASPGDVLQAIESPVPDGDYYECVEVTKPVTIMPYDEGSPTLIADDCIGFNILADSVTIFGFDITEANTGICVDQAIDVTIRNNTIHHNDVGIKLVGASAAVNYNEFCFNNFSVTYEEAPMPLPPQDKGGKAVLISEGFEGTWIADPDGDGYMVPNDATYGAWDIDGLCVDSQAGYPQLTHYISQMADYGGYGLPHTGTYCAGAWWSDGNGGDTVQDEWLITPELDLSAFMNTEMTFYGIWNWASTYPDDVTIEVSTDGGATWTTEAALLTDPAYEVGTGGPAGAGWCWNEYQVVLDLSAYDFESSVLIAYRIDGGGSTMAGINYIDDIEILADPAGGDWYTLDVNIVGAGTVELDPDLIEYYEDSVVELTAIADPSWVFDHWEGDLTGFDNPALLTMDDNKVVTAVFVVDLSGDVGIHYNYFGCDECETPGIAIYNYDEGTTLDARWNWYSAVDGPSGDTIDATTGRIANGFGYSVFGNLNFDPWWGIDACADISDLNVLVGDAITFDAGNSFGFGFDEDDLVLSYLWDFDNMDYSMNEMISYSYDEPGIYKGYLRVSAVDLDLSGFAMYDWDYFTIVVSEPGQALSANADGNDLGGYEASVRTPVTLYGIATGGVPGYTFEWDINGQTLTGQTVEYSFDEAGTYTVELTVTDSEFNTATDTATVYVAGLDELVAKAGGPYQTTADELVQLIGQATGGKAPYAYTWEFGDGTTPVTAQNPLHVYEAEGTYTVTLTVTDSYGTVDETTTTVTVSQEHDEPEIINVKGGLSVKATVVAADLPVDWTITIDGNYVFGRTTATGTVAPNAQETIRAPYVFGLGNVDITITANDVVSQHTAFMLGPIVLSLS